jgi:glycosyltransferase involved in cell wall biosynthesis
MRRLKLCFVGPAASVSLQRWVQWFADRGHDCHVLTVEPSGPAVASQLRELNLTVSWLPRKCGRLLSAVRLIRALNRIKPDLVHLHYLRGLAWGLVLHCPYPSVMTPWGSDVLAEQGAFREWYSKGLTSRLLRRADLITTHSAYMETMVKRLLQDIRSVVRVGWGVDLQRFRPGIDTSMLRQQMKIRIDQSIIFSPRLLQPMYRHELVINAMPYVLRAVPGAVLVLTEYFADPAYVRQLQQRVADLGVAEHVRFVGSLAYTDMPVWFNLASAVVMVPTSDGMPNSLLEAMACGATPVLNGLPQYDELVRDQVNGRRVAGNHESLAEALVQVLQDDSFRAQCRRENRALIEMLGDQEKEMSKMEGLYQHLAGDVVQEKGWKARSCVQ